MTTKTLPALYRLPDGRLVVVHFAAGRKPPASTTLVLDDGRVVGAVRSAQAVRS